MEKDVFFNLSTQAVADLVDEKGKPKAGIFIPDGNRRLVLAETDLAPNSDAFFSQVAHSQTGHGLNTLKVFFSHGLPILFAPLFSASVLARGPAYYRLTALKTLEIMVTSREWVEFFTSMQVRVRVYGALSELADKGDQHILGLVEQVQQATQAHAAHLLYLGIGGEPWVGHDGAMAGARFYDTHRRVPTNSPADRDELLRLLYGQPVPPADFLIMSSQLAGLGALPALVCGKDTQVYYLAAPGVVGLTQQTYRAILYDLLYSREVAKHEISSPGERRQLRTWYQQHAQIVVGLGHKIGAVWVPDLFERDH